MRHIDYRESSTKPLAIALALISYDVEYRIMAAGNMPSKHSKNANNDNGRGYVCDKAELMWTTHEGERWTFSYHAPSGEKVIDYVNTLREFDTKEEAEPAMAGLVWALNGAKGEYPR